MRESLLERLKKEKPSFTQELLRIAQIIECSKTASRYFLEAFDCSPYSLYFDSFDNALEKLIVIDTNFEFWRGGHDWRRILEDLANCHFELTLDSFLDFLEFFKTLLMYPFDDDDFNIEQIDRIIDNDCERVGYTFEFDDVTFKVRHRNPNAESVAARQETDISKKIYGYLAIRNGRIDDKRECIKSLADDVELICIKYSNIQEYNKLKQFIQCTRHTKKAPKKEFPFYYDDEEKWLDRTFEMIVGILSFTKTKEIVAEIKKLEVNNL